MLASLIILAISFASAAAGPFVNCKTQRAGVLAAPIFTPTYTLKSFTLAANGQVAYRGNGENPLVAEYQVCASLNEPGVPEDGVYYGTTFRVVTQTQAHQYSQGVCSCLPSTNALPYQTSRTILSRTSPHSPRATRATLKNLHSSPVLETTSSG